MVVREVYFDAYHKVQLLPAHVVGRAVCDVRFRGRQAASVLVGRAVCALPGVVGLGVLGQLQLPMLVTHTAKELVGMLQVLPL